MFYQGRQDSRFITSGRAGSIGFYEIVETDSSILKGSGNLLSKLPGPHAADDGSIRESATVPFGDNE